MNEMTKKRTLISPTEQGTPVPIGDEIRIQVEKKPGESHEEAVIRMFPQTYDLFGRDLLPLEEIEHALQTTYRIRLLSRFTRALKDYEMLKPGDKVAVAISGGKDSLLLAKLFQILQRYTKIPFELDFLAMDPGYAPINRDLLIFNLAWLGIPARVKKSDIFQVSETISQKPCYLCARMRRGFLYGNAKEMGCNKVALGHHFNDVIETTLLNLLWSANYKIMMPKIIAQNFDHMELIRPMYYIEESSIIAFRDFIGLKALDCACSVTASKESSQRREVKALIQKLKKDNPNVEKSIFRSGENVAVDAILGYVNRGKKHSFLEHYGDEEWNF